MTDSTPRSRKRTYAGTWLNNSLSPIFMLDAQRRIVFFNAGCESLTGWQAADVVGQTCEYTIDDPRNELSRLTCSLCPPPDVLRNESHAVPAHVISKTGRELPRLIHYFPVENDEEETQYIIGILRPLPPRKGITASPAQKLHAELAGIRNELRQRYNLANVIAVVPAMKRILGQVELASQSAVSVWMSGEAGTGREHLARVIHNCSENNARALVPLDCQRMPGIDIQLTLSRLLQDSEEQPDHLSAGTILFKNIHAIPRDVQQSILELFSGTRVPRFVRMISITNQDPLSLMESDTLLPEMYHLLSTVTIDCPPLRNRAEELDLLAQMFLETGNRGDKRQVGGFSPDVMQRFRKYNWPGNLTELRLVVEEARAKSDGSEIEESHLPFRFRTGTDAQTVGPERRMEKVSLEEILAETEREQIQRALEATSNNKSKAAELLGITRHRLLRRIDALGLK